MKGLLPWAEPFVLKFDYETAPDGRRVTTCTVEVGTPGNVRRSYGAAACIPEDQFVKETGRKLALTRAIKHFTREVRGLIWQAYHGRATRRNE